MTDDDERAWDDAQRALCAPYAVRADDPARLPMTLDQAAAHLSAFHGSVVVPGDRLDQGVFCAADALEAATWWYLPYRWIGCCGFVVEKRTGQVHAMGSNAGLETYLWAQARGLLVEHADLVVDQVRDREASVATLRTIVRWPSGDHHPLHGLAAEGMGAALESLPARFPSQRPGLWLRQLREAVDAGAFTCHMEPPTVAPLAPGAWHVVLDVGAIRAAAESYGLCERLLDHVHARRLEIDATTGLRALAIDGDVAQMTQRERNRQHSKRWRVPGRLVGPEHAEPQDEAAELAATFAAGGATTLVTTDVAAAAARVAPDIRVIDLATLVAHVGTAE